MKPQNRRYRAPNNAEATKSLAAEPSPPVDLPANDSEPEFESLEPAARQEQPHRPTARSPMAFLIVCDDGETTGEVIRLRTDRFIIGRTEGDLRLPDDEQVSSKHLSLSRQLVDGEPRWVVTDLQSRNGLFVRVGKAPLVHMSEFLIGSGRYRLECSNENIAETAAFVASGADSSATRGFEEATAGGFDVLSEIMPRGLGARYVLKKDEYWIGSDKDCEVCRDDDLFVSGKHAKLTRSQNGTWVIKNQTTINGVWIRMPQLVLEIGKKCEFQIGEQRFRLRFGVPL